MKDNLMQSKIKNILMVYPEYSKTFWSFENILKILGKKASFPPLGLLSISSMLPAGWNKKLIDMNIDPLTDADIQWADYVFISAMIVQKDSAVRAIERIKKLGKTIVAGGPLFTTSWEDFDDVDHLFLGEAENTLPQFIADIESSSTQRIYESKEFPDITSLSVPDWKLVNIFRYHSMCIQYSRGCPFNCEFCDVVILNGRTPRTKTSAQIIEELDNLYDLGWRGGIFFVDDNLIGNKQRLKKEVLPEIIEWQKRKRFPFSFNTQVSINLSDDEELIKLLVSAGFTTVFVGIETPEEGSLEECSKYHNKNRDLINSVKKLQNFGLEVQGGFIVGFDNDTPAIFQKQIDFIQKSGIVTAMVGLLSAIPKTRLYKRLFDSKRITTESTGNNTSVSTMNFIPKMEPKLLFSGYKKILDTIYGPKEYYARIRTFLREFKPPKRRVQKIRLFHIRALFSSFWLLGIRDRGRKYFWGLLAWVLIKYPGLFPYAVGYSVAGIHFRTVSTETK
ncbi:MAG: biotin synthase [Actinobacteria bacterium ADurb.Bin346]|nr:MAG: biotin synthase [Actinobacteria bacterium ADurb.Bin346]